MRPELVLTAAAAMSSVLAILPASAQDAANPAASESAITLDLNAVEPSDAGCRLTFVVANNLSGPLDKAAFEIALFNAKGQVDRLTVLDFKELPAGKTKVRRFDLAGTQCAEISRVLVNDATECAGAGVDAAACMRSLTTASTSGVTFGL